MSVLIQSFWFVLLIGHVFLTANCHNLNVGHNSCFRAAVFEHNRFDSTDCKLSSAENLRIYEKVSKIARENGANIIVFPEDGIFAGSKSTVLPCLEEIPNPNLNDESRDTYSKGQETNFCSLKNNLDEQDDNKLPIMTKLSCIAKENQLYVVANFGTRQTCSPDSFVGEQKCPSDGFLMLNTNVVFDSNGNFVRRYRKYNIFVEIFDKAPELELVHFDTPFGRFGVFTCFDIMFREPAIDLVEMYQIDSVVFPTWWFDSVPILTAIQFQDTWSWRNNVNLLAANILRPRQGSAGSGIYSVENSSVYVGSTNKRSTLLLKDLPSSRSVADRGNVPSCSKSPPLIVSLDDETASSDEYVPHAHNSLLQEDLVYTLDKNKDDTTICHKEVCCRLVYELEESAETTVRKLILIMRDGPRPRLKFYEQFCVLATTSSEFHLSNMASTKFDLFASVNFVKLSLTATFGTEYVFPTASHNVSSLIERSDREFVCEPLEAHRTSCRHSLLEAQKVQPVNSFGLYARYYGDTR